MVYLPSHLLLKKMTKYPNKYKALVYTEDNKQTYCAVTKFSRSYAFLFDMKQILISDTHQELQLLYLIWELLRILVVERY